ncbi:MAG: histidine phosphatase family protein [Roseiflexaceae bacterium]
MLEAIYLVRHAAPDRGAGLPYNVLPGPPLTADGRREAAEAARWLAGHGVEQLLASSFERARATAEAISTELALPIAFVEALREGAPGEKVEQVRARMAELRQQLDDGAPRCVALVTHGVCIRTLLQLTTNDRIDLSGHVYDNGNCTPTAGIWHGVRGDHCWRWELAFRPTPPQPL